MNQSNHPIKLVVLEDPLATAKYVADLFCDAMTENTSCVLGLATGGTPVETYRELSERNRKETCDFSSVITFNLDEYIGLEPRHPQSFRRFMQDHLFDHVNINLINTHVPDGMADDVNEECARYENRIRDAGGIDLQLLGIGHNGHIAFNEPGSPADSRTRKVALTDETIEKNARFFDSVADVPREAITMGIGTIMEAKRIVLMATGEGKREAIRKMINGPRTPDSPASLLQDHANVTVVVDRAAAGELAK